MNHLSTDPILSCEDSLAFERTFFGGDEEHEWQVMNRAGEGIGDAMLRDDEGITHDTSTSQNTCISGEGGTTVEMPYWQPNGSYELFRRQGP